MPQPAKISLLVLLHANYPAVASFRVTVSEFCPDDHPPSSGTWSYTGEEIEGRTIFTTLKHDKSTMQTASFALLSPVSSAAMQRKEKLQGKLPAYSTDSGQCVTRYYECNVVYKEEKKEPAIPSVHSSP